MSEIISVLLWIISVFFMFLFVGGMELKFYAFAIVCFVISALLITRMVLHLVEDIQTYKLIRIKRGKK